MQSPTTSTAWLATAWTPSVRSRALRTSALVGSLLAVINHGDALLSGHLTCSQLMRIALTYLVPYCVATFSAVQAIRHLQRTLPNPSEST